MESLKFKIIETLVVVSCQWVIMHVLDKRLKFSTSKLLNKCRKIYSTYTCKAAVFVLLFTLGSYVIHKMLDKEFISYDSSSEFEIWIFCIICSICVLAILTDLILLWRRRVFARTLSSNDYRLWLIETLKRIYPGWSPVAGSETQPDKNHTVEYASAVFDFNRNFK